MYIILWFRNFASLHWEMMINICRGCTVRVLCTCVWFRLISRTGAYRTKWEKRVTTYVKPPTGAACAQIILLTVVAAIAIDQCVRDQSWWRGNNRERVNEIGTWQRERGGGEYSATQTLLAHARTESPCE